MEFISTTLFPAWWVLFSFHHSHCFQAGLDETESQGRIAQTAFTWHWHARHAQSTWAVERSVSVTKKEQAEAGTWERRYLSRCFSSAGSALSHPHSSLLCLCCPLFLAHWSLSQPPVLCWVFTCISCFFYPDSSGINCFSDTDLMKLSPWHHVRSGAYAQVAGKRAGLMHTR